MSVNHITQTNSLDDHAQFKTEHQPLPPGGSIPLWARFFASFSHADAESDKLLYVSANKGVTITAAAIRAVCEHGKESFWLPLDHHLDRLSVLGLATRNLVAFCPGLQGD